MITIRCDYNDFGKQFKSFLDAATIDRDITIDILPYEKCSNLVSAENTPFATNPVVRIRNAFVIAYNSHIIEVCKLTVPEQHACLMHEVAHILEANGVDGRVAASGDELEMRCDGLAQKVGLTMYMISALYKMQENLHVNLQTRIEELVSHFQLFRPEWTCGRYNEEKQVSIMYNLIEGFSYFFDGFSAQVIGEILKVGRNEDIRVASIASKTGIHVLSLCAFFDLLIQKGLLSFTVPTEEGILNYRHRVHEWRKDNQAWVDKATKEKLPMEVTNAEQSYFDAVDDGKTICSCMFELTYRCSEMCIHCYNPGATRNNDERSHRGEFKELSLEDYKRIIDDMYNHGLVKVCLSGGDPFSKEFTWDLLDYLYEKGVAVDIFTNGQRIVDDVARLAKYYPRHVGVSIYSGREEDHDAITRIRGSWRRSIHVVEELSQLAVPMNLKCCVMQPNLHSYYMVADLAKKYCATPQFELNISESNDGDICAKHLRLTEEQLQVVLRDSNVSLYVGKEAPNYGGQKRDLLMPSCGAGRMGFCMSPNGDLRACAAFTQVYGNLLENSVNEILSYSKELKGWRESIVANYAECGRHDYCDYCNLCAGLNYTEHGDYRLPAESNCYMAKCRYHLAQELMEHDAEMTREELIAALQNLPIERIVLRREYRTRG